MEYPINRFTMETKRLLDVLDRRLGETRFLAGDTYTITDIAAWPWSGALVLGRFYDAAEFLDVHSYHNVRRWTDEIDVRPATRHGRMVNRSWGMPSEQLRERHAPSDFELKTQDKIDHKL
jgi:GST-like protein